MKRKCLLIVLAAVGITFLLTTAFLTAKSIHKKWIDTQEEPFALANVLVEEVPTIKEYFSDKLHLLESVQEIFDSQEDFFHSVFGRGKDILVYYENSNSEKAEFLADSGIFNTEQKQQISTLFCEDGPIYEYQGFYRLDNKGVIPLTNLTDIRIMFLQEDEVEKLANSNYYMEEFADHWFICVTINWFFVDEEDVELHKMDLPGQGLVRISGQGDGTQDTIQ